MGLLTLYALFGDDIRVLSTDKNGDPVFWIINIIVMIAFIIEIILASFATVTLFTNNILFFFKK